MSTFNPFHIQGIYKSPFLFGAVTPKAFADKVREIKDKEEVKRLVEEVSKAARGRDYALKELFRLL